MTWKDYNHIGSGENKSIHIIHSLKKKKERNNNTCIPIYSSTGYRSKRWFAVVAHSFVHSPIYLFSIYVYFLFSSLYSYTHVGLYEHRIHLRMSTEDVHIVLPRVQSSSPFSQLACGSGTGSRSSCRKLPAREAALGQGARGCPALLPAAGSIPLHCPVQLTRIKLGCWFLPDSKCTKEEHVKMNASNMFQRRDKTKDQ